MTSERFAVEPTAYAEKDLRRLRPWSEHAARVLARLRDDAYRGHALSGSLPGTRSLELTLKGGGANRAVYAVLAAEQVCLVFVVGPHENIYDRAERRVATVKRSGRL